MGDGGGAAAAGAGPGFEKFRREVRILFPSSPGPWHAHAHLRLDWARGWTLGGRRGQRGRERGAAAEVAPRGARSLAAASRIRCHFVCCGPAVGKWWWRSPGSWACLGGGCWSTACVESDVAVLELRGGQVGLGCGAIPIVWCPGLFLLADHCFSPPCGFLGTSVLRDCPSRSSGSFVSSHPPSLCSLHARTRAGFLSRRLTRWTRRSCGWRPKPRP